MLKFALNGNFGAVSGKTGMLKCTADVGDFYRMIYPGKVVRGYHCPPVQQPYWNTIHLADFPEDELYHMIDLAYDTVLNSFSKKVQKEILSREK